MTLPDGRTLTDLAREHTVDAVAALVRLLKSESDAAAVSAATALLDRGWGRPRQDLAVGVDENFDALADVIRERRKRVIAERDG